jgi:hypothetical protein
MPDGCFEIRTVVFTCVVVVVLGGLVGCTESDPESRERGKDAGDRDASEHDAPDAAELELPDGGSDEPALEPGQWALMDFDARKQFMRDTVVPTMRPLFQEFDAGRFAAVSCRTCHGSGAQAGTFRLPNADLPVLDNEALKNPPESQKPILAFMRGVLKPKLGELLGMQDASEFRCTTCHTSAP